MEQWAEELVAAVAEAAAEKQYGLVTKQQLLAAGVSSGRVQRLVERRRLEVLIAQVFAFPGSYKARLRVFAAAVLWYGSADRRGLSVALEPSAPSGARDARAETAVTGPDGEPELRRGVTLIGPPRRAALSHWSAAEVWALQAIPRRTNVHVLREGRKCPPAHESFEPHATDLLPPEDVVLHEHVPVTTALRTIVDLAACVTDHELELAILDAVERRLFTATQLKERLAAERARKIHGLGALEFVVERAGFDIVTESPLERETLQVLLDAGLRPEGQHKLLRLPGDVFVARYDLVFRKEKVLIEVDSRRWHRAWKNKVRDGEKTDAAVALGYEVVRVRKRDLYEPGRRAFLRRVREALATAPVRAAMTWPRSRLKPVKRRPPQEPGRK